jgi:hypothetical protein
MSEEPDIFQARLWAWPTAACAPHTVCVTGSLGDADTERCRRLAHAWRRMRTGLKKETPAISAGFVYRHKHYEILSWTCFSSAVVQAQKKAGNGQALHSVSRRLYRQSQN